MVNASPAAVRELIAKEPKRPALPKITPIDEGFLTAMSARPSPFTSGSSASGLALSPPAPLAIGSVMRKPMELDATLNCAMVMVCERVLPP